jgi:maleylacetate reductase
MYFFTTAAGGSVIGGVGALDRLTELAAPRPGGRALIVTSPSIVQEASILAAVIGAIAPMDVEVFSAVRPGSPMEIVEAGAKRAQDFAAELVISVGGGSAVDTAKGIVWHAADGGALRRHIAIPSTLSGAEFTTDAGLSVNGHKQVLRDRALIPSAILLDPRVLATAPSALLRASVLNAFAHCVEGVISTSASPMTQAYHLHALRLLQDAAPALVGDRAALTTTDLINLQAAAALAALNQITMGISHVLVHALGGLGTASHAVKHGAIAPIGLAFNAGQSPDGLALLGNALGAPRDPRSAVMAAREFASRLGAPRGLADLGLTEADRPVLVERTMADPDLATNPRAVRGADEIAALIEFTWTDIDAGLLPVLAASADGSAQH